MEMSQMAQAMVKAEAEKAAKEGKKPNEACPYPFGSEKANHWLAHWILAGGTL